MEGTGKTLDLKELRTQLHLSQEYVANYLGIDKSLYEQMERGDWVLSDEGAIRLSTLFGVPICDFLNQ